MTTYTTDNPEIALKLARSEAMECYSSLEQSLCETFTRLTGMERDIAGLVFFKIGSARARDSIILKLIKRQFDGQYNAGWNSIMKLTSLFSERRNELAHWASVSVVGGNGNTHVLGVDPVDDCKLVPPNHWWRYEEPVERTINEIFSWAADFSYLSRVINIFNFQAFEAPNHKGLEEKAQASLEKYRAAIPYPPHEDDPRYRKPSEWQSPRQASPQ